MAEAQAEGSSISGVVLHFNSESVLFEFSLAESGDDVQIGVVKPSNIKVGTKFIPANVKKIETLSKYIEVGDELSCTVVRGDGLKKVTYQDEEEEGGKMTEVEVQPAWLATTAVKALPGQEAENGNVEMENPFYEPRRSNRNSTSPVKDVSIEKDSSSDGLEDEEGVDKLCAPVKVVETDLTQPTCSQDGLELPEPVMASYSAETNGNSERQEENKSGQEESTKADKEVEMFTSQSILKEDEEKSDNKSPEIIPSKNVQEEEEDMLELEVNQSEFEELGGSQLDSSQEKDEDEDVEIIELLDENSKKRKISATKEVPVKKSKDMFKLPSPVNSYKDSNTFKIPAPVSSSKTIIASPIKVTPTKETSSITEALQSSSPEPVSTENDEDTFTAKLVQFKKSGSVKLKGKVTSGILEVLDGEHKGKKGLFQVASCYVWGHHLANANLMYNLRAGDKFMVQVALKVGAAVEEMDVPLIVKKCWLGVKSEVPLVATMSVSFSAWLMERSLAEGEFLKWVGDLLPDKPFYPLKSEQFEAKVIMLIRENPKGDGALVRITKEGEMKDNLAVFERDDFYICGVFVGEADMRFLIRPGDSLTIQVKELTEREKKAKTKKYPKLDEFEFNHSCILAYIGDSRPRGPNMRPGDSPELRQFLDGKGMSIQEFSQMRDSPDPEDSTPPPQKSPVQQPNMGPGLLPPPMMNMNWLVNPPPVGGMSMPPMYPPPMLPHMGSLPYPIPTSSAPPISSTEGKPNMEMITKCSTLVAKAVILGNDKDPKIGDLLKTEEDIEHGLFLAKMFTSSLVANVQGHLKEKIKAKVGSSYGEVLSSMNRQLDMAHKQLINTVSQKDIIQAAATAAASVPVSNQKPMSHAMLLAQQSTLASLPPQLAVHPPLQQQPLPQPIHQIIIKPFNMNLVDQYDKQQQEPKNDFITNKGMIAMSDMKKRLEAFKAAKKVDSKLLGKKVKQVERAESPEIIEVNDNSNFRWDNKEASEEQSMSPLELLRKYTILKRPVEIKGGKVYFREISFPQDCRTNLKINKPITGEGPEFYTLGCLYYFLKLRNDLHPEYVRKCISEDIKCVRRPDRKNVEQYLTGAKDYVLNLESLSHRKLNPELFGDPTDQGLGKYGDNDGVEYGGGGGSEGYDPVEAGKSKAERLVEQWRNNHLGDNQVSDKERHGSGGNRRSSGRDKHSSDRDRRNSGGRNSRSSDRDRRGRSRSRERRKRSRSRSGGRGDRYDPLEPTLSPTQPIAPPPPAFNRPDNSFGFGRDQVAKADANRFQHQERSQSFGISPFDQRQQARGGGESLSPFDQRTRPPGVAVESPFDQARAGMNRFDQRSNGFDQSERPLSSGFDRISNRMDEGNQIGQIGVGFGNEQDRKPEFDQKPQLALQNQTRFGQEYPMRNQSRFDPGPWGNQPAFPQEEQRQPQSRFDQIESRSSRFDQEGPNQEHPRGIGSRFDQEHQPSRSLSRFGVNTSNFGQEDLNTEYSEYGEPNPGRDFSQPGSWPDDDRSGQNQNRVNMGDGGLIESSRDSQDFHGRGGGRSLMGENMRNQMFGMDGLDNGDGRQGGNFNRFNDRGEVGGGGIRASSSLGPMFTIGSQGGQGNMPGNSDARR
eukprot:GFUD01018672.1.p1 GENE.GFUD01018672.1~~GFUD01018672.1.p1  ORF type:complete len:1604 (+),score=493.83 GFUD01018672.1:83-4894(+)